MMLASSSSRFHTHSRLFTSMSSIRRSALSLSAISSARVPSDPMRQSVWRLLVASRANAPAEPASSMAQAASAILLSEAPAMFW
mgnify:CR=1 FL=1